MGLFGRQSKMDSDVETVEAVLPEQYEEVPELPTPLSTTTIAKGVTVTGTLHGEGIIQIEGTVEGEIDLTGAVVVKETGLVKGPVTADTIRVAGCISGDVVARGSRIIGNQSKQAVDQKGNEEKDYYHVEQAFKYIFNHNSSLLVE